MTDVRSPRNGSTVLTFLNSCREGNHKTTVIWNTKENNYKSSTIKICSIKALKHLLNNKNIVLKGRQSKQAPHPKKKNNNNKTLQTAMTIQKRRTTFYPDCFGHAHHNMDLTLGFVFTLDSTFNGSRKHSAMEISKTTLHALTSHLGFLCFCVTCFVRF